MNFICRKNDEDPQFSDEFLRKITDISQWTLLETFWSEYPDLVQGLPLEIMLGLDIFMPAADTQHI